jgi:hypothetical protein
MKYTDDYNNYYVKYLVLNDNKKKVLSPWVKGEDSGMIKTIQCGSDIWGYAPESYSCISNKTVFAKENDFFIKLYIFR